MTARFSLATGFRSASYVSSSEGGLAAEDPGELPGQVLGIGDAGVQAARAERRHHVRRVAREKDTTGAERIGQALAEAVGGDPDELVWRLGADHVADAPIEAAVARSTSASVSGGTCQSIRHTPSGWGWMSTWRPGFHGGSKWKWRSLAERQLRADVG